MAAAVQGRQVDAIRVSLEYAQSAAAGKEIKEPPVAMRRICRASAGSGPA
jgi:hypothetical protein